MISRGPVNSVRMPALRVPGWRPFWPPSSPADLVLLTLFLNPEVTLRGDAWALLTSLLPPWAAMALPGLWLVVAVSAVLPGWPRAVRPPLEALPGLTTAALVAALRRRRPPSGSAWSAIAIRCRSRCSRPWPSRRSR